LQEHELVWKIVEGEAARIGALQDKLAAESKMRALHKAVANELQALVKSGQISEKTQRAILTKASLALE